ncbi:MAG: hypothetical protein HFG20_07865 [Anaerotruncus sp.]|nr:hypothetical protein [Anaerotruncus sp.]
MNKTTTAVTGAAVAVAAGTAAYMLSHNRHNNAKSLKKNATKTIRTLGSVLGNIEQMMH